MSLTRANILDRMVFLTGDDSTGFRSHIQVSINNMLFALWEKHDWNFKHKSGQFNTVNGTESYDISVTSTDVRSSTDIECLWDSTNKRFLNPVELRDIRKADPGQINTVNQPSVFAPWGSKSVFLFPIPSGVFTLKYLYTAKPTLPTSDSDDLETVCGLPDYVQPLFEKMVTAEAFLGYDDSRRNSMLAEIYQPNFGGNPGWMAQAIAADMKHLENQTRFKFWEEELVQSGFTYDDFLRKSFWSNQY